MKAINISLLFIALFAITTANSQEQPDIRTKANRFYNQFEYSKAIMIYQKLVDKKPLLEDVERLASSYEKTKDFESAEKWYSRAIQYPSSKPENLLAYATVLKLNGKYHEAKKAYTEYSGKTGINTDVALAGCDSAETWIQSPTTHTLTNEEGINNSLSQFSVFVNKDKVYYISESEDESVKAYGWTGRSYLGIYDAEKSSTGLIGRGLTQTIAQNPALHAGPFLSNSEGTMFIVTKTSAEKPTAVKTESAKFPTKMLNIFFYFKNSSGNWVETPFKYNSGSYSVGHAALSNDSQNLYFVSDMPGGCGGKDIWFSEKQTDGSWSKPQNCGSAVNTTGDEEFPTISESNVMHFSSNGLTGMGGLDIYRTTGKKADWEQPVNLKYPINSSADDFSFTEIKNAYGFTGYFSSNRKGGKGNDDIYSFNFVSPIRFSLALDAKVLNKQDNTPVAGVTLLLVKNTGGVISSETMKEGFAELEKNTQYTVIAKRSGFFPDSIKISTVGVTKSDTLEVDMHLDPLLVKGKTIQLDNIFYDSGKDNIKPEAAVVLNGLEQLLRENPTLKIELSSHTDSRGKDSDNLALSQRRAQAAVNYLISRGVSKTRMVPKGYGETRLINNCGNNIKCSDVDYQKNRRTEITILSF
jgi:outer membrane protein OmpA-like peptidoglycan-associated protein